MTHIDELLKKNRIFDSNDKLHRKLFLEILKKLTIFHRDNCKKYKKFITYLSDNNYFNDLKDLPFLPVQIFKLNKLMSINVKDVFKTLSSSGTSSMRRSQIFLDKKNAENQIKVLNKILSQRFGKKRFPMLIVDKDPTKQNRLEFSASTAAIYGFSIIASKKYYLLNDNNEINYEVLKKFIKECSNKNFFIFGFTSSIYQFLLQKIKGEKIDFSKGTLIHGGGWKKLSKLNISNKIFKDALYKKFKLKKIINYYGLVEQTGSIFFECDNGFFVSSIFSDIIIRGKNFEVLPANQKGLIQLFSVLPSSYPGHNLITEDIGSIKDENFKCNCGLKGKHFLVHGRAQQAEIRGCSDAK